MTSLIQITRLGDSLNVPVTFANPNVPNYDFSAMVVRFQAITGPTDPILWESSNGTASQGVIAFTPLVVTFAPGSATMTANADTSGWPVGQVRLILSIQHPTLGRYTVSETNVSITHT